VGAASTKAAVTVGVNAPLTSGKKNGTISASWNVCEVKSVLSLPIFGQETKFNRTKARIALMLNIKKIMAMAIVAAFLISIPLSLSTNCQDIASVTYTISVDDYFAKPVGTPGGGGKPSPGYKLTGYKWLTLPLTIKVNPDGLDASFIYSAIFASAEEWDSNTKVELVNNYQVSPSVKLDGPTDDGINEIVFGPIADSNIIAQCTFWFNRRTKGLVDFEIVFNTYYSWGDALATAGVMDVQNIATHELGHGFGLADLYDSQWSEQTMYGYGSAGETKKRTLETGDIAGIQKLYC